VKKKNSSFERITAMQLRDSLCSNDKYKGPLFARKKNRSYRFFFFLVLIAASIFLWKSSSGASPGWKAAFSKFFESRSLASDKQ